MKKTLNATSIVNELRGQSAFFPSRKSQTTQQIDSSPVLLPEAQPAQQKKEASPHDTVIPRHHDTSVSSDHDTVIPVNEAEMIEAVRKAVKQIGKEAATQRLTLEEKKALKAIEFTYGQQGILTSGNEIIRIGMNYALKDYQKNGENSILAKVLKSLNS